METIRNTANQLSENIADSQEDGNRGCLVHLSDAYAELVALGRRQFLRRKDRRIEELGEEASPLDVFGMGLITALQDGKVTASLLREELLPIPTQAWWSPRIALIGRDERQMIFLANNSAHRLFQRLATNLPAGYPDGVVVLRRKDLQRWLQRFKAIANELEPKNEDEDMALALKKLLDPGNPDQPHTKADAKRQVKERLCLKFMNERAFNRAWEQVTRKMGRGDLRRPGRRPKANAAMQ